MDDVYIKLKINTVYGKLTGDASGPLVLAIHGWSKRNGWQTWEPMMGPLAAAGYCVVSVDMPGWGQSPAIDAVPLMGERAAGVVAEIMNGLQKQTAVLLGKSWGGGVAVQTALSYPERVTHLVLTAPAVLPSQLPHLGTLSQPVLLAWAEDDPAIPYENAERLTARIPDVTLETYATGGHEAAQANVADFAPKVIEFLDN
ncbi:MAG TPA: alpha/beta fold hydrolase [Anaerolineae bacterium]|nr:alpha/beta fold hydrolase [Anaerolineae bacterium]